MQETTALRCGGDRGLGSRKAGGFFFAGFQEAVSEGCLGAGRGSMGRADGLSSSSVMAASMVRGLFFFADPGRGAEPP